jgi:thiamine biosynthesis lipoprotein
MGTVFTFQIADDFEPSRIDKDLKTASEILDDADNQFSLYKPDSEVSKILRGELRWNQASETQRGIRESCSEWKLKTSGFFDAEPESGKYDPSGLVKTWATRNAALYLEANGYQDFTINAGGDIYFGPNVTTSPLTRVGLSNFVSVSSTDAGTNLVLELRGSNYFGVATSGSSERGDHIWPTKGSMIPDQFLQATVVASDLVTADIWATALVSGGTRALSVFEERVEPEQGVALVTYKDGRMSSTRGFTRLLASLV